MEKIFIKGDLKEGIKLIPNSSLGWEEIKEAIWEELEKREKFLRGFSISIDLKNIKVEEEEWRDFQEKIFKRFGIMLTKEISVIKITEKNIAQVIIGPIRNGQRIVSKDNLLIVGDINPGGEVISEKSIFVLGKVKGFIYAGAKNNEKALIFALGLQPIHMQIGEIIWEKENITDSKSGYWVYVEDNKLKISIYLL